MVFSVAFKVALDFVLSTWGWGFGRLGNFASLHLFASLPTASSAPDLTSPLWQSLSVFFFFFLAIKIERGLPWWPSGKESAYSAGDAEDVGLIPGLGRFSCGRKWQLTPVFLPGSFHRQRSLVGYSPWESQRVRHD